MVEDGLLVFKGSLGTMIQGLGQVYFSKIVLFERDLSERGSIRTLYLSECFGDVFAKEEE